MKQAVGSESWPVSTCLRFSIEYSRMRVLQTLKAAFGRMGPAFAERAADIRLQAELHQATVSRWKHKCESQLGMLAVCKSNSVFEMVPSSQVPYECPFRIKDTYRDSTYYVGPASCLVYIKQSNSFYDPCLHPQKPCTKDQEYTLQQLLDAAQQTLVKFDVRSLGNGEVLGTWPIKFFGLDEVSTVSTST